MQQSSLRKAFALRSLIQSLFFATLLFAVAAILHWRSQDLGTPPNLPEYGAMFVFLVFFALLQWIVLKNTLARLLDAKSAAPVLKAAKPIKPSETGAEREKRITAQKRLFVHLFSVLQREGRLMDFFQEDLAKYEDAQIGAAVRSVHENCSKTVKRYLSPEPVMRQGEGETVEIEAGFDRQAIKLVGNVGSQPPFSGIVRHRGWQLRTISLPELSEAQNPNLIAPAEIEIQ